MQNKRNSVKKNKKYLMGLLAIPSVLVIAPLTSISMSVNTYKSSTSSTNIQLQNSKAINGIEADANGEYVINQALLGEGVTTSDATKLEGRGIDQSAFRPTGFFVNANTTLTIKTNHIPSAPLANGTNGIYAYIGQWDAWADLNGGADLAPVKYNISSDVTQITPTISGMLYFSNESLSDVTINSVSGAGLVQVPTFTRDKTTVSDFIAQTQASSLPMVEIVGKNVFVTIQKSLVMKAIAKTGLADLNERTQKIDQWVDIANKVWGLDPSYDGAAHKYGQMVNFVARDLPNDTTYANAPTKRIRLWQSASMDILTADLTKMWGLPHEIGHTFQTPGYTWNGLGEVTVNLLPMTMLDVYGLPYRAGVIDAVKSYFSTVPIESRDFNAMSSVFGKLGMFWQLRMAFGNNFYPWLSQAYRVLSSESIPVTSADKEQQFMFMASKISQRNLVNFFKFWGIKISDDTIAKINALGFALPINSIENNLVSPDRIVENELPEYSPTSKDFYDSGKIPFAEPYNEGNYDSFFNHNTPITRAKSDYMKLSKIDGVWTVPTKVWQKAEGKAENIYNDTHWVSMDNMDLMKVLGSVSALSGYISVNHMDRKIYFQGNSQLFSSKTPTGFFGSITIKDNSGNVIRTITMLNGDNLSKIIAVNNLSDGIDFVDGGSVTIAFESAARGNLFDNATNDFTALTQKEMTFRFY